MTSKHIDTTISSIITTNGSVFNIIETSTGFYYSLKDNSAPPQPIGLDKLNSNGWFDIYLSNGENNEYWAYNQMESRETLILLKANQEIYQFEEPAFGITLNDTRFINFHVLDNRWVVVIIHNKSDNKVICRTHDLLNKKSSQTNRLADLHLSTSNRTRVFIYTYTVGNQIIIFTPEQIARLGVHPDDGTQYISLDFTVAPSTIFNSVIDTVYIAGGYSSNYYIQIKHYHTSDETNTSNLLVYMNRNYGNCEYHCLTETPLCLGMVNTKTLETTPYHSYTKPILNPTTSLVPEFPGVYEYLAPDIIIHRPDLLHLREQYLTLLVPGDTATGDRPKEIRVNIHEFEPQKEQRKYYHIDMADDSRVFTLIYTKSQDNTWTIYQVDRQLRQIIHMVINKPKKTKHDIYIEITKTHSIRVYNFNLNQDTIRDICPSTINMVSVLTGIPEPIARLVGQFAKQKIINY